MALDVQRVVRLIYESIHTIPETGGYRESQFLQGVSIACYAQTYSYGRDVCPSICLSVCHTLALCQTHEIFTEG